MNIDIMHYASPPVVGGVESVIGHHARMLADDGHSVRILAGRGDQFDPRVDFVKLPLIDSRHDDILKIKASLDKGEIPSGFKNMSDRIFKSLAEKLDETDILIAHNVCSLAKNLPLTAAVHRLIIEKENIKYILWQHDLAWRSARYKKELYDGYPWNLLKQRLLSVEYVVVSEGRQIELADLYGMEPGEIHVIPNGLQVSNFLKLDSQTVNFINKLGLFEADPLLLLPVRITRRKNIEFALNVVKSLVEVYPKTILLVTGPLGPHNPANIEYFRELLEMRNELSISKSVFFLAEYSDEFIPDEVISDLYHISDGLFLPSKEEGFGIPVLEAGLAGIPIFCSDIAPLRELGGSYADFFSVSSAPEDVAGMIISRYSEDATFMMRVNVRNHYTWKNIYRTKIMPLIGV